jgi:hypothetical protein
MFDWTRLKAAMAPGSRQRQRRALDYNPENALDEQTLLRRQIQPET